MLEPAFHRFLFSFLQALICALVSVSTTMISSIVTLPVLLFVLAALISYASVGFCITAILPVCHAEFLHNPPALTVFFCKFTHDGPYTFFLIYIIYLFLVNLSIIHLLLQIMLLLPLILLLIVLYQIIFFLLFLYLLFYPQY